MLSRNAENLYWLGRYLGRALHLSRLLQLQMETQVDRPRREIHHGWRRIYISLQRSPPVATADFELYKDDDLTLADAYTLADDLTFEASNPDSLRSCFAHGRNNARQLRNCISASMWTCLNQAWLQLKDMQLATIWQPSPENFYAHMVQQLCTFSGIAQATMYRDQSWHFLQIGCALEHAQQSVALLSAQLELSCAQHDVHDIDWASLLSLYQASDTYKWRYGARIDVAQVIRLLSTDPCLPSSLRHAHQQISGAVTALPVGKTVAERELRQLCTELVSSLRDDDAPSTTAVTSTQLEQLRAWLLQLDRLLAATWFNYSIEDHLPRHG